MAKKKHRPKKKYVPGAKAVNSWIQGLVLQSWNSMDVGPDGEPTYSANRPYSLVEKAVFEPRRWYFAALAKCRTDCGDEYEEWIEVITHDPILLNDIRDPALKMLDDVKLKVNERHIYDTGWIAKPLTPKLQEYLRYEAALAGPR